MIDALGGLSPVLWAELVSPCPGLLCLVSPFSSESSPRPLHLLHGSEGSTSFRRVDLPSMQVRKLPQSA
jgi:hypothetical protein